MEDTKSVLIVTTSYARIDEQHPTGLWFEEFAVPYEYFAEAGYLVTVASIKGGRVPVDPRSLPEDQEAMEVKGPLAALKYSQRLMELDVSEYDAVFFPGGHGTMFDFPPSHEVAELVSYYLEHDKPVAAVCHGPAALIEVKDRQGTAIVKGRTLTAFSNAEERAVELDTLMPFLLEDKLRELGADVQVAPKWQSHVVIDGLLITGQNPQSSHKTAEALVQTLSG